MKKKSQTQGYMDIISGKSKMTNLTIIMNKEDVKNPLHPDLWESWLETLGVDPEATEVELCLSSQDENKKVEV